MSFDRVDNREIIREWQAIKAAETHVEQHVGPIMGMDSEFGVYRAALKKLGADTKGLYGSAAAAKTIFTALTTKGAPRRKLAQDSAADKKRLEEIFPNMNRLGRTGW